MTILLATADPRSLMLRASNLIDNGRLGAARPLLAALRGQVSTASLRRLTIRMMLRAGRLHEACEELDAAILADQDDASLHKQRGQLRLQLHDSAGAASDAADAVILDRHDAEAKALLGLALTRLGRGEDAAKCLAEALAAEPTNAAFRIAYAQALARTGSESLAIDSLFEGTQAMPHRQDLQEELILALGRADRWQQAVDAAHAAQRHGALGPCGFGLLGHALSSLNRHAEAADAYREAYKLAPEDPYVRHMVAASGGLPSGTRAPPEYLRAVFDGYADHFEQSLIGLGYRVPGLIRAALKQGGADVVGPTLDLGCGTGLVAVALSDLAVAPMVGVDLSRRMLAHAAEKRLYADLAEADILTFLKGNETGWKLVTAADVFCYTGDLHETLALIAQRLTAGGRCIFSVELLDPQDDGSACRLNSSARFAHTHQHVCQALREAGLTADQVRPELIRYDAGQPIQGLFISSRKLAT